MCALIYIVKDARFPSVDNENSGQTAWSDLSLCLAHMSEGSLSHVEAQMLFFIITKTRLFNYIENFASKK